MTKSFFIIVLLTLTFLSSAQTSWKSIEHKNGFHMKVPAYFKKGLLVASRTLQYYENTRDSSIAITVESFGSGTTNALKQEYKKSLESHKVNYSTLKPTWFVVSGTDEEGIFYLKTIISQGLMHYLRISYPSNKQTQVDQFLGKMVASFH